MHGVAPPNVPSKDPSIVRRRSRGSLPRLHLRLFSSSSKCSLFESSRRSKVTVRPLHKDQAPSLTPRQVSFDCPKNASRLLQTLNVRHPNPVPIATGSHIAFVKGSAGRHPGVLVVGGSEGGLPRQKAAWLASHGYVAFALAYFRYEDLPPDLSGFPLEYFGQALGWMKQRPEVLADHIAVVGTSRGGELALQLASMYPQIGAVVAYVPANVRYGGCCGNPRFPYAWTWQGQPLAYYQPRGRGPQNPTTALEAAIAVEHIHGPVLLISGEEDDVWPSSLMTNVIEGRLKSAHFGYPAQHLNYSHAGHMAGRPEIVPAWHGSVRQPISGREMNLGGTPKGDAESTLDAIPKVLEFLRASLDSSSASEPAASPQN